VIRVRRIERQSGCCAHSWCVATALLWSRRSRSGPGRATLSNWSGRAAPPAAGDLEELATVLEGDRDHGDGRIGLATGEVWPSAALEYAEQTGELGGAGDPDRWLWAESEGSREGLT
jgi:hypothetical protein